MPDVPVEEFRESVHRGLASHQKGQCGLRAEMDSGSFLIIKDNQSDPLLFSNAQTFYR